MSLKSCINLLSCICYVGLLRTGFAEFTPHVQRGEKRRYVTAQSRRYPNWPFRPKGTTSKYFEYNLETRIS